MSTSRRRSQNKTNNMKTKSKPILSRLIAVTGLITSASFATNIFDPGWCTYGAAAKFDTVATSPGLDWNGDAGRWVENAAAKSWVTWTSPKMVEPNCIIVWKSVNGAAGHVGFVTRVFPGGFEITEMNAGAPVSGRTDGWTDKAGIYTSHSFTFAAGLDRYNKQNVRTLQFSGYVMPRKVTSLRSSASLDAQATIDVNATIVGDSRFGQWKGAWVNVNWQPDWQLRGVQFSTGWFQTTTVFHATHRTDPKLRSTIYQDPSSGQWIGWRNFRN